LKEGIEDKKLFMTGNTIVDAVFQNLKLAKSDLLNDMGLKEGCEVKVAVKDKKLVIEPAT
jgi:UDP-N-acetylglucosamine 2-epimerase (non-hydrolysing)